MHTENVEGECKKFKLIRSIPQKIIIAKVSYIIIYTLATKQINGPWRKYSFMRTVEHLINTNACVNPIFNRLKYMKRRQL